jgi:hypothetical protein
LGFVSGIDAAERLIAFASGAVGLERIRAAVREAAEPFLLNDGGIEIQPNAFTYVVATL